MGHPAPIRFLLRRREQGRKKKAPEFPRRLFSSPEFQPHPRRRKDTPSVLTVRPAATDCREWGYLTLLAALVSMATVHDTFSKCFRGSGIRRHVSKSSIDSCGFPRSLG